MVPPAIGVEVALVGGPRTCAGIVRFAVVEVTAVSWSQARREATERRPSYKQVAQYGRRPVDGGSVVNGCAGDRIGENPPPGCPGITGHLTEAEQHEVRTPKRVEQSGSVVDTASGARSPARSSLGADRLSTASGPSR